MPSNNKDIGIVFPSGQLNISEEKRENRLKQIRQRGLEPTLFEPQTPSEDGSSAGYTLDRAMHLAQALTLRSNSTLWAAKGGFGSTSLLLALEQMLPPVLPEKILVGYSDVSFIGTVLSFKYPNLHYIMGGHAFEENLFETKSLQADLTVKLMKGETVPPIEQDVPLSFVNESENDTIDGSILPLNLSLAESLATLRNLRPPRGNILFLEDINEDFYRILRKFDSLRNSGFLQHSEAIVLGNFTACTDAEDKEVEPEVLARSVHQRTGLPTFVLPIFGHDNWRMPLVAGARVEFAKKQGTEWQVSLSFDRPKTNSSTSKLHTGAKVLDVPRKRLDKTCVHFLGIGGTGMTAVAGLAKKAGLSVTGSDGPIYPPMSNVLSSLGIKPAVGYKKENIRPEETDLVVLANAISRLDGSLQKNEEFEALLQTHLSTLSFPAFLREYFLKDSFNIVAAGTHGKTTTTSALAFAFQELGNDPSYLIGGSPLNFSQGFHFGKKDLFILEGDEYDTALFDKGPKFLHYEPRVALINNIEFDHADIYSDLTAIQAEFRRLAEVTAAKKGIVVANADSVNVHEVLRESDIPTLFFGSKDVDLDGPYWQLLKLKTLEDGSELELRSPNGQKHTVRTKLFGHHNALNIVASMTVLHAYHLLQEKHEGYSSERLLKAAAELSSSAAERWSEALGGFRGVKRRFELLYQKDQLSVFDDFAHHPTAVRETLAAFRDYHNVTHKPGKLRVCFDPRNATMRRSVLQNELAQSLEGADQVYLGRAAQDLRIPEAQRFNGRQVAEKIGSCARAFEESNSLLNSLIEETTPGDTVVFMSSGSFDNLPASFVESLKGNGQKGTP